MNNNKKFLQKVDQYKQKEDECWNWQGSISSGGYGMYNNKFAHRMSYEHFIDEIPKNMIINHLCKNRLCINPNHLIIATIQENSQYSSYKRMGVKQKSFSRPSGDSGEVLLQKFFDRVEIPEDENNCWEWIGSKRDDGYGTFRLSNIKRIAAHRLSYQIFIEEVPEGLVINHICENKGCVNPGHLEAVTTAENNQYSIYNGSKIKENDLEELKQLLTNSNMSYQKLAEKFGVKRGRIGVINKQYNIRKIYTKLTKNQVEKIKKLLEKEELSQGDIAKIYNTKQTNISEIYRRYFGNKTYHPKNWKSKKGATNNNASLTEENVIEIKKMLSENQKLSIISKQFNVSDQSIYRIKNGKTWIHINV